jgi:hypothetical protein
MPDQLVISDGLHLGIGLEILEEIFLIDAFVESQPNAGYVIHAGDNLNSWQDGQPKIAFSYGLMVSETIEYWAAALQESLQGGSSVVIALDPEDSLNHWQDFIPGFRMAWGVAVHETLLMEDFVTMSQVSHITIIAESEADVLALIDFLDLGYGIEL